MWCWINPALRRAAATGPSSGECRRWTGGHARIAGVEIQRRGLRDDDGQRFNQALRADKGGETLNWKSEKTSASGSVTPLNRLEWQGLSCRRLQIHNVFGDLKAKGVYRFCEKPAGPGSSSDRTEPCRERGGGEAAASAAVAAMPAGCGHASAMTDAQRMY